MQRMAWILGQPLAKAYLLSERILSGLGMEVALLMPPAHHHSDRESCHDQTKAKFDKKLFSVQPVGGPIFQLGIRQQTVDEPGECGGVVQVMQAFPQVAADT